MIDWWDYRRSADGRRTRNKYATQAERDAGSKERHRNRSMRYRQNLKARGLRLYNGRLVRFATCSHPCGCDMPIYEIGWCGLCKGGLCD